MENKRQFFWQAVLLTGISLLLRSAGVGTQVYISAKTGAEAVGIFSLIGGVGGFAVTLALSGIQMGCTRLVAQGLGKRDISYIHDTMRCAIGHALFFGFFSFSLLFFGAEVIGRLWLRDLRAVSSLRVMAISLPFIALCSCLSGYFIAVRRVWKSGGIQVLEEILRISCTVFLLRHMASRGLESALLAVALSNALADVISSFIMLLVYAIDKKQHFSKEKSRRPKGVLRELLSVTLPVATAAYARSGLITLEHMLIPVGLQRFGQSHAAALAAYGMMQSMAIPIILFPGAFLGSFAGLLVPELTEAHIRNETKRLLGMMQRVLWLSLMFSIGTAGVIICYSGELGILFYDSKEVARYIRILAPLIPIMYMDSVTDALLKGLGEQVYSMKVNIIDASLSVLLVWLLLPVFGIYGYIVTIYITELLNATLSLVRLLSIIPFKPRVFSWILKPLVCIIGATLLCRRSFYGLLGVSETSSTSLILQLIFAVATYVLLMYICGALRKKDIIWLKSFIISG